MTRQAAELVHVWHRCHACLAQPIVGRRFECQVCPAGPDNDLCEGCYRAFERGTVRHPSPESLSVPAGDPRHVFRALEGRRREKFLHWLAVPWAAAPAPAVADRFVVRPEFRSGRESFFGSYGFVVAAEDGGLPLMLTALHVMDELIRHHGIDCAAGNSAYTGRELARVVAGAALYDAFAAKWMLAELGSADGMLVMPQARIPAEEPYSQSDIAAFRLRPAAPVRPARLARTAPAVGDPIWLAASRGGGRERTFAAVVVEMTAETLIFRFASPAADMPPYTSGAPLLNRAGEVVGINIGRGMLDGEQLGHANHVTSVRRHLGWDA